MGATSNVIFSVYKTLVRSLVDYTAPVFFNITASDATTLETILNDALRTVNGTPIWTKTDNPRGEAQVSTLVDRVEHLTANFLIRTYTRDDHRDYAHQALLRHHEGRRGQGKWITKAASI
ncbi:hypothetical protein E2C01_064384 [Portunus trituberculatus]|uniref:Uncharacterized protein n=1 Tax=Portunus trituberculatus TaxID=210409 RepID=A0A5B7HKP0_PORTR|nr:hypothetical protein [Portunus trituberculatus]